MAADGTAVGRHLAVSLCACLLSELTVGWFFGFGTFISHFTFWILMGLVAASAYRLAAAFWTVGTLADLWIRAIVIAFSIIVTCGLVLGAVHVVFPLAYVAAEVVVLVAALSLTAAQTPAVGRQFLSAPLLGLTFAIVAFVIGMGISHSPFDAYDSLSYHLFFPARWLQAHRLFLIPTPFSDEAQAYQPANGELWFLWLLLPFHGDFLARVGQIPFYLLAMTTAWALARRLGVTSGCALYASVLLSLTPTVVEQAIGADVDLIFAAMFLVSLYFGIVAVETNEPRDWALWGMSAGLYLGTKYLALVYLPVFLVLPFVRSVRLRALWALPGILAFAMPWYLRNWLVAGSPIYPATLTIAGITLGQGAYTHHAMLRSYLHSTNPRLLLGSLIHAFGAGLFLFIVPAFVLAVGAVVRRRAWWPAGFVIVSTAAVITLCWVGVGDNTDSRFVLPAVVMAVTVLPLAFGTNRRINTGIHTLFALGIAWTLVGWDTSIQASVPRYMSDWFSLVGVVSHPFLVYFLGLALVAAWLWRVGRSRGWAMPAAVALVAITGGTLAMGAEKWCVPSRCAYLSTPVPYIRANYLFGSRWLTANVNDATVAYTGINLPYPLEGSHLENVVSYVNIDGHADWRFDQYADAFQAGLIPIGGSNGTPLAEGSGLLMPLPPSEGRFDALRPRFERMRGTEMAWKANLMRAGVTVVFISKLDPYEIDYTWHNEQGFPVEDEWAKSDAETFRLVYNNPDVRIYRVASE